MFVLIQLGWFFTLVIHLNILFVGAETTPANLEQIQRKLGQRRKLFSFESIDPTCQNVETSILKGPSNLFNNLTNPLIYDLKKRPNTAPIN